MNILKELEKIGIIPKVELKMEEKNQIAKNVADKLATNIKELNNSYNELYMRIFNCNMYYATVDRKFRGVFYYYKNNTIYIDENKDIFNVDMYLIHESIHYLQNFSKISKKSNRAGLCQFTDFKIHGLGLNEAMVQYITAKAIGNSNYRINNEVITICTNSANYYKYMTSIIAQILFLMGEKKAIESCINSNHYFEEELYNTFEEDTDKILKGLDCILDEYNKTNKEEQKIIDIYMNVQEIIYKHYFISTCKRLTELYEVDQQVEKLEAYSEIVGRLLNTSVENDNFNSFKANMESKFLKKYIEINSSQQKNSLMLVYKNFIYNLWSKISVFVQKNIIKKNN